MSSMHSWEAAETITRMILQCIALYQKIFVTDGPHKVISTEKMGPKTYTVDMNAVCFGSRVIPGTERIHAMNVLMHRVVFELTWIH